MANVITVSALNKYVKSLLESDPVLTDIAIRGEISNFKLHYKTGHCYFTLKDNNSSVKAVMFRQNAQKLAFKPEDGINVIARCRISLFERDGSFQIYVEDLFPDGIGAAQLAFEQLKKKLSQEGLFAPEAKKPLPQYPACVGLVTSKTGAALQDILKVSNKRCPGADFILAPVTVQGLAAADEIAKGITKLDKSGLVDVIIIARGGGSAEDLWVFNAETIARAVYQCKTPVVSAIGHETDVTIVDFVADQRAATPSAAAEIVFPDLYSKYHTFEIICNNISKNIHNRQESWYNKMQTIAQHPSLKKVKQIPEENHEKIKMISGGITKEMSRKLEIAELKLKSAYGAAAGLNPYSVLAKGYTVARIEEQVVSSVNQLEVGGEIDLSFSDGKANCRVESIIKQ